MKQLANSIIFTLGLLFIVVGCNNSASKPLTTEEQSTLQSEEIQKKNDQAWQDARELLNTITDSEFLQTTEPMTNRVLQMADPATELKENRPHNGVIYYKALERVKKHTYEKDNQVYTTLKSGAEVNIAEDLFTFITDTLYGIYWNQALKDGKVIVTYDTDDGLIDIIRTKEKE